MNTALDVITFPDRRQDGWLPVLDTGGSPLAWIQVPWGGRRFTAVTADGTALCSGQTRLFARSLDLVDASGAPLLALVQGGLTGPRRLVSFVNGAELKLEHASWPSRDWGVLDASGHVALAVTATTRGMFSQPDSYAVQIGDPRLSLAELVGIVQGNRTLVQAERARRRASG